MSSQLAAPSRRRPQLGDFSVHECSTHGEVYKLVECPLCGLDPERERHFFAHRSRREAHFFNEHGPDDVGRPMAELLGESEAG